MTNSLYRTKTDAIMISALASLIKRGASLRGFDPGAFRLSAASSWGTDCLDGEEIRNLLPVPRIMHVQYFAT